MGIIAIVYKQAGDDSHAVRILRQVVLKVLIELGSIIVLLAVFGDLLAEGLKPHRLDVVNLDLNAQKEVLDVLLDPTEPLLAKRAVEESQIYNFLFLVNVVLHDAGVQIVGLPVLLILVQVVERLWLLYRLEELQYGLQRLFDSPLFAYESPQGSHPVLLIGNSERDYPGPVLQGIYPLHLLLLRFRHLLAFHQFIIRTVIIRWIFEEASLIGAARWESCFPTSQSEGCWSC